MRVGACADELRIMIGVPVCVAVHCVGGSRRTVSRGVSGVLFLF
jgi:hypothetical protein